MTMPDADFDDDPFWDWDLADDGFCDLDCPICFPDDGWDYPW